jgi:membrane protease YdiL (CAAX protease family)
MKLSEELIAVYIMIAELTAWLMGSRLFSLLRTGRMLHPVELLAVACVLWKFRFEYKCVLPYKSTPIAFLASSLAYQIWSSPSTSPTIGASISSGILVPLYEEVLYRVVIIQVVEKRLSQTLSFTFRTLISVSLSSLLFMFAHRMTVESLSDLLVSLASGLALSSIYLASVKNIVEPLLIHVLHNLHALLASGSETNFTTPIIFYSVVFLWSWVRLDSEQ